MAPEHRRQRASDTTELFLLEVQGCETPSPNHGGVFLFTAGIIICTILLIWNTVLLFTLKEEKVFLPNLLLPSGIFYVPIHTGLASLPTQQMHTDTCMPHTHTLTGSSRNVSKKKDGNGNDQGTECLFN